MKKIVCVGLLVVCSLIFAACGRDAYGLNGEWEATAAAWIARDIWEFSGSQITRTQIFDRISSSDQTDAEITSETFENWVLAHELTEAAEFTFRYARYEERQYGPLVITRWFVYYYIDFPPDITHGTFTLPGDGIIEIQWVHEERPQISIFTHTQDMMEIGGERLARVR